MCTLNWFSWIIGREFFPQNGMKCSNVGVIALTKEREIELGGKETDAVISIRMEGRRWSLILLYFEQQQKRAQTSEDDALKFININSNQ